MEKVHVKILGIAAAHRKGMNTAWLVQYALKAAEKVGRRLSEVVTIDTELIDLARQKIKPCRNCEFRHMTNRGMPYTGERPKPMGCPIKDDIVAKELLPKMKEADGYIYGSPTYGLSYCSQFRLATERLTPGVWEGAFSYKPACAVTVGEMPLAGQETCLADINRIICGSESICVSWYLGVPGVSGPPIGPHPADKDYFTKIGAKKHRYSQWLAVVNGRRVAETAVMQKIAKKQLGPLWEREFLHVCHPPHGEEPWAWRRLDKEDEEYMDNLSRGFSTKGALGKAIEAEEQE
jgi:multimeric flavodoxin WrbA